MEVIVDGFSLFSIALDESTDSNHRHCSNLDFCQSNKITPWDGINDGNNQGCGFV